MPYPCDQQFGSNCKKFLERGTQVPCVLLKDKHGNESCDYNEVGMVQKKMAYIDHTHSLQVES